MKIPPDVYTYPAKHFHTCVFLGLCLKTGCCFPGGSEVKGPACNAGDLGSILGQEDSLEKEMATHSSILTWRIPWTEEPGGLQPMRSQRVRHD